MVTSKDTQYAVQELTSCLNTQTLLDLARRFSETYKRLARESTEHFLITPVTALPTGKETGKFLTIDVGGSNLRVGLVELAGESVSVLNKDDVTARIKRSHDKSWPIGDHLKMDKPEELFSWIGDCMAEVLREAIDNRSISRDGEVPLGVTFSFPMAQTKLSEATLLPMGKGFAITTNLNLGEMLQTGYARHCSTIGKLPRIRVAAITNDTVATFVSLAYAVKAAPNSRVAMGLIVGTGTNATVPMRPGNLHTEKQSQIRHLATTDNVVINTEWTIRGTDEPLEALKIKTDWDRRLDQSSDAPGFQPFEYMTSGKYLGEIVRLALLDILDAEVDAADIPSALRHKDALSTRFLSEVVARLDEDTVRAQLKKEYPSNDLANDSFWTPTRMRQLCDIARAVQQRSSALIAAASIGLLDCVGDIRLSVNSTAQSSLIEHTSNSQPDVEELVVAYTGSTIAHYPCWLDDCQRWVDELVAAPGINIKKRVVLKEALDGGIIGAGVLAGMENRV